jgi:hypothetical protein
MPQLNGRITPMEDAFAVSRMRNVARPIMWRVRRGAALSAVPRRIFAT